MNLLCFQSIEINEPSIKEKSVTSKILCTNTKGIRRKFLLRLKYENKVDQRNLPLLRIASTMPILNYGLFTQEIRLKFEITKSDQDLLDDLLDIFSKDIFINKLASYYISYSKRGAQMNEEEYAIVSKKEFLKLKNELEKLKKNPLQGTPAGENLQESIDNLSGSLNSMMTLFKEAADDLKIEERDTQIVAKKLDPLMEKVDTLIEQNQKIAKGIVAVADMVREKLSEIEEKTHAEPVKEERKELPPLGGAPAPPGMPPEPAGMGDMPPPPGMPEPEMPPMPADMPPPPGMPDIPGPMPSRKKPILGGFLKK